MTRKKKLKVPPPDSPLWKNQTKFRILERTMKRKGEINSQFLIDLSEWKSSEISLFNNRKAAYFLDEFPGFILIKNGIPVDMQNQIIRLALEEWAKSPNISNLDSHFVLSTEGIWNDFVSSKSKEMPIYVEKRHFTPDVQSAVIDQPDIKMTESDGHEAFEKCKEECQNQSKNVVSVHDTDLNIVIDKPTDSMLNTKDALIEKVMPRLRWCTLGYQYNWSKKEYHFDRNPEFPEYLKKISEEIVDSISHLTKYSVEKWKPEAGILNFYQPGDSLTAHQDKSEVNTVAPLLSLSFGLDCIFLFGTENRAEEPLAIKLSSGDLVILSGPARRAYHGVPRVIEGSCPKELLDDENWRDLRDFISHTRMNINIRQVY
jgi:alkylated DNA repair protein alkB family protein 1